MARPSFAQRKRFVGDFLRAAAGGLGMFAPILAFLALLIVCGGVLIAWLDQVPTRDGIYLALVTALTIGYGDLTPQQPLARLVAILVGVLGLAFSGLVVAVAVNAANAALERNDAASGDER